ncbi:WD repeat-containing protein 37-like isoform X1 [Daphnia carinata]|uniref:WD repeat-containing protein 37-like isoform X1 n=1 Tax=Daphnia carinata TaxID=120202 RepID=UPI00257CFC1B|nr:WD repeat-containing protein 37-like isoform X1 [Daphnia carinata]
MASSKPPKTRRIRMPGTPRPSGGDDFGAGFLSLSFGRTDTMEGADPVSILPPAFRSRLYGLFNQIEREFEALYSENLLLQEKVDSLSERTDRDGVVGDRGGLDQTDFDSFFTRNLLKQKSSTGSAQKMKPSHRLKAQTSRIVSSFKAPAITCALSRQFRGHRDGVWDVTTSKTFPLVGSASADGTACIWSTESSRCLLQYQGHKGSVNSMRFHPTKDLVMTASGDQTCHLWQAAISPEQMYSQQKGLSSEEEVETSEREDNLGPADEDYTLPLGPWATLRTPVCELVGHTNAVIAADWIAGGDQAVTASWDRTANIWDVTTGELLHQLVGHDQELTHTSAHPIQRLVVTASKDTTFRLWDFRDPIHSVSVFQGHSEVVTCVTFTREDKVVSGSDDRTAKVWDLRNMRSPLASIRCESPVNKVSVSPSNVIAVPLDNRNVLLFDLNGQRLARLPRSNRTGHRRMVCATAWGEENINTRCNLFTCGFDRMVYGWNVQPNKEFKD